MLWGHFSADFSADFGAGILTLPNGHQALFFVKPQPVCSGGFLILPLNGAGAVRVRPESRYAKNAANGAALRNEPLPTGDAAALKSLMMLHPGAYIIKILPIWFNNGAP